MLICFDRPRRWFNKLWCVAFHQRYCHVRILLPVTGTLFEDFEFTWDGCYAGVLVDVEENFPNLDTVVCIPNECYPNITHIEDRFRGLRYLQLRWSTWTALTALLTGSFPGFTCASATWYALTGCIDHNVKPDDIYEYITNEA